MAKRTPKSSDKTQSEEFIETARRLGMDESRDAFERAFKRVTSIPLRPGAAVRRKQTHKKKD